MDFVVKVAFFYSYPRLYIPQVSDSLILLPQKPK